MHNKKTSKLFFNISMAALVASAIVTASVMTGCSSDNKDSSKETEVVHGTEVATYEVNGVVVDQDGNVLDKDGKKTGETVPSLPDSIKNKQESGKSSSGSSSASGSSKDNKQSKASSGSSNSSSSKASGSNSQSKQSTASAGAKTSGGNKTSSSASNNSNNANNSNKSGNNNNSSSRSSSSSSQQSSRSSQSSNTSGNTLSIGNKKFNVGDTVVCTYNLQNASEKLLNYQGFIKYDGSYLKVKNAKLEGSASSGGLLNADLNQEIRFNGSNLNGYNYTKSKPFVTVEYEVLKAGKTAPKINWEVITGLSEKKYCDNNGGLINGITVSANYSNQ